MSAEAAGQMAEHILGAADASPCVTSMTSFDHLLSRLLDMLPVACRLVGDDGSVLWRSQECIQLSDSSTRSCCTSLGFRHHDADCLSIRTIRLGTPQCGARWLGKKYLSIETTPLRDQTGKVIASF
jgi:hypothetical protein